MIPLKDFTDEDEDEDDDEDDEHDEDDDENDEDNEDDEDDEDEKYDENEEYEEDEEDDAQMSVSCAAAFSSPAVARRACPGPQETRVYSSCFEKWFHLEL